MKNLSQAIESLSNSAVKSEYNQFPISKSTWEYQNIKNALIFDKNKYNSGTLVLRPCFAQGTSRFSKQVNYTESTIALLNRCGIDFKLTNIAPKGGQHGNVITIIVAK